MERTNKIWTNMKENVFKWKMEKAMRLYDTPRGRTRWSSQSKYIAQEPGVHKMTKLSLSEDACCRKIWNENSSYESNQVKIDAHWIPWAYTTIRHLLLFAKQVQRKLVYLNANNYKQEESLELVTRAMFEMTTKKHYCLLRSVCTFVTIYWLRTFTKRSFVIYCKRQITKFKWLYSSIHYTLLQLPASKVSIITRHVYWHFQFYINDPAIILIPWF